VIDGSTDSTQAALETISDERMRILTRAPPSGRPAIARNAGIAQARGELLAFLDDDDHWYPNKLAAQVAYLDAHPDCALVSSRCRWVGEEERIWPDQRLTGFTYNKLIESNMIACSMVLTRASAVREAGGFDTSPRLRLGEDWDLWLRIAQRHPFAVLQAVHGDYAVHQQGMSRDRVRQLCGLITVLSRLAEREPGSRRSVEGRVRHHRRQLARELVSRLRLADAARVLTGHDERLVF